jgi:hypothetical protein
MAQTNRLLVVRGESMTLMSQSDFAAHIGVNRSHVTQLKNAGRLVMEGSKVSVVASIKRIDETRDPAKEGVAARHEKERQQKQAPSIPDEITSKSGSVYQNAKAMRETYNAKQAKLDYEKNTGILLVADEARLAVADGDTVIRNRLESLPDILAPQLAAETDEQKIRSMLMDHIESLLGELSRSFYDMAKI